MNIITTPSSFFTGIMWVLHWKSDPETETKVQHQKENESYIISRPGISVSQDVFTGPKCIEKHLFSLLIDELFGP